MTTLRRCFGSEKVPPPPPVPPLTCYDCMPSMLATFGIFHHMIIYQVPSTQWLMTLLACRIFHSKNYSHIFHSVSPQPLPWTGCSLSSEMSFLVTMALCEKRSDPAWFLPTMRGNCGWHSVPSTTLTNDTEPIPYLQVVGHRYRTRPFAPSQQPVRSGTVSDVHCLVGQTYQLLGGKDYRLDHRGKFDFRLQRQIRSYEKEDPPPRIVKPIPIQLVQHVLTAAHSGTTAQATADMICIAFFFLLRPGEYSFTKTNTPFRLRDAKLYIGTTVLQSYNASPTEFSSVTTVSLTFTTQ
jgi:hypothetical protein